MSTMDRLTIMFAAWAFAFGMFNPFLESKRLQVCMVVCALAASICWAFAS